MGMNIILMIVNAMCYICPLIISLGYCRYDFLLEKNYYQRMMICLIGPIVEEILFRYVLIILTRDYSYYIEINITLFIIYHIPDLLKRNNMRELIVVTSLGYFFVILDNLFYSIIAHVLFNSIIECYCIILQIGFDQIMIEKEEQKKVFIADLEKRSAYLEN